MPTISARQPFAALALAAVLSASNALAADSLFSLNGLTDSGPLADQPFVGSFAYDASTVTVDFTGAIPLSAFMLQFAGMTYDLMSASANSTPVAAFANGQFLGLEYSDDNAVDTSARPHVALVPGFSSFLGDAYFSYLGANSAGGFGDYSVAVVPEPDALLLMLAGLGVVGGMARRARRGEAQVDR